jgi:hypothetical protein
VACPVTSGVDIGFDETMFSFWMGDEGVPPEQRPTVGGIFHGLWDFVGWALFSNVKRPH